MATALSGCSIEVQSASWNIKNKIKVFLFQCFRSDSFISRHTTDQSQLLIAAVAVAIAVILLMLTPRNSFFSQENRLLH